MPLTLSSPTFRVAPLVNKGFAPHLGALRGIVALLVVVHHIFVYNKYLDPGYFPEGINSSFKFLSSVGHLGVLVFFVISGYVIGLSTERLRNKADILMYLKKRLVRLYPIYFISVVFALLVAEKSYSLSTMLLNLSFAQINLAPVVWENCPIWSLNYEVIYYLLFIPVSYYRINPVHLVVAAIAVGLLNYLAFPAVNLPALTSYAIGFAFWSSGLVLARYFKNASKTTDFTRLLSLTFLLISLVYFNALAAAFNRVVLLVFGNSIEFTGAYWAETMIKFAYLSYLPYILLIILSFSDCSFRYQRQIALFLQLLPALIFVSLIPKVGSEAIIPSLVPGGFYIISLVLFFSSKKLLNKPVKRVMDMASWAGNISYGIYIIHFPILVMFQRVEAFSGTPFTLITRLLLYLTLTIGVGYLLEIKFQPRARKILLG